MGLKQEIQSAEHIRILVDNFYKKVIQDEVIGYFFTKVVVLDWDHHIPTMYQFWETILLAKAAYKGNPVIKHVELSQKEALKEVHFDRWIFLWEETIDEHFEGPVAEEAKKKALTMKQLMLFKIDQYTNPDFIQ